MKITKLVAFVILMSLMSMNIMYFSAEKSYADVIEQDECFPAVLMLRGSGESIDDGTINGENFYYNENSPQNLYIKTNGYEGDRISELIQAFVNKTDPIETVSKTRFIGVDYKALPVYPDYISNESITSFSAKTILHMIAYQDSYNDGGEKVVDIIRADEARGCNTQYMIVGYSQGVISARLAINLLDGNEDKIISTYVIGDPVNDGSVELSERQISPAHATSDMDGVLRTGLTALKNAQGTSLPGMIAASRTQAYLDKFIGADDIIYRDDVEKGIYSRVLCHDQDITCDTWGGSGIENHVNYFQATLDATNPSPGDIDLQYEIDAFDEQVKILANSAASNPRARVVKKTPSVDTSSTLYNVANTRPDDQCSWDEGNDSVYEVVNIPCDVYTYENTADVEKMRVRVTDSFGSDYFFELEDEVLEIEQVERVLNLDPNSWYQFKVKDAPGIVTENYCLEWFEVHPQDEIQHYMNALDTVKCTENLQGGNAVDARQVFKHQKEGKGRRLVSGYDDRYSIGKRDYGLDTIASVELTVPDLDKPNDVQPYPFAPSLGEVVDGKIYYLLRNGNDCLTIREVHVDDSHDWVYVDECTNADNQLFEAIEIEGEFGALSVERDTTPPSAPQNFLVEVDNRGWFTLIWDKVYDRGMETDYQVDKFVGSETPVDQRMVDANDSESAWIGYVEEGIRETYGIFAVDEVCYWNPEGEPCDVPDGELEERANKYLSEYTMLSFVAPGPIAKPTKPVVNNTTATSITLNLPAYQSKNMRGVRIYDGEEYLGTHTGTTATFDTTRGTKHQFTYRYELNDQVVSMKSNILEITIL